MPRKGVATCSGRTSPWPAAVMRACAASGAKADPSLRLLLKQAARFGELSHRAPYQAAGLRVGIIFGRDLGAGAPPVTHHSLHLATPEHALLVGLDPVT
jgi:hypothetical protein